VQAIADSDACFAPVLRGDDINRIEPNIDFWDAWPVQGMDGAPAVLPNGDTLWMALGAPRFEDPDERHGHARIHLLSSDGENWRHHGPAMPDGFSPGSREWSGSALLEVDRSQIVLYFTATGRRGEADLTFEQRIFAARATLEQSAGNYRLVQWRDLHEAVARDGEHYMDSRDGSAAVGTIKAFRDPAFFHDPQSGRDYLFFAGSAAGSRSAFNGVVGAAVAVEGQLDTWQILPPLISADGINNELERPHVVVHDGLYYLFWSTQAHVFNPAAATGPTGLYGMVARSLSGPWHPINGSGLLFANPPESPRQAYSWLVLPSLQVMSFADDWGESRPADEKRRFAGTFAPFLQLWLDGERGGLRG